MCGHVVGSFVGVSEQSVAIRYHSGQKRFQVATHLWVGVFAEEQRGARVVTEQVAEPDLNSALQDDRCDLGREVIGAATVRWHGHASLSDHLCVGVFRSVLCILQPRSDL